MMPCVTSRPAEAAAEGPLHDAPASTAPQAASLLHLELNVVFAGLGTEANFLQLNLMRFLVLGRLALLFVLELAVIQNSADGRPLQRRDFDEIQAGVISGAQSVGRRQYAQHLAILVHNTDLRDADLLIDAMCIRRRSPLH